jgi:hypothetical protein
LKSKLGCIKIFELRLTASPYTHDSQKKEFWAIIGHLVLIFTAMEIKVRSYVRKNGDKVSGYVRRLGEIAMGMFTPTEEPPEEVFKPSVSHLGAEVLAKAAYSNGANLPAKYQLVDSYEDEETGLSVSVFKSPKAKPVIAFRGSANTQNWLNNFNPKGIGTDEFEENQEALAQLAAKYPKATVTGHSLGGAIAQRYAANFGANEVITFNAPGIDKATAKKGKKTKATHYVADGDPVSLAGEQFLDGDVKVIRFDSGKIPIAGNALDKHMRVVEAGLIGMQGVKVKSVKSSDLSHKNYQYGSLRATGFLPRGEIEKLRSKVGGHIQPYKPGINIAMKAINQFGGTQ